MSSSPGMTLTTGIGRPVPDLSLNTLDGQTVNLSTLQDQKMLLLFGATWCPHCQSALESLENLNQAHSDDLLIFFVAAGQNADELNEYFGSQPPSYTIIPDKDAKLSRRFAIKRIPVCAFIDKSGLVTHTGRFNELTVTRLLSGQRLKYPQTQPANSQARDRLALKSATPSAPERYIIELDEPPRHAKKLSKAAVNARRKQYETAARSIGARVIHNYGKLKKRIVVEIDSTNSHKLKNLPAFKKYTEDRRVHALLEDSAYQIKADYA
ncbi:MAG: TlpA family protein disulfide reductase, partial [Planctomycetota bacterium]